MRRRVGIIGLAVALTACGSSGGPISDAFCADLDSGLTLMNLWDRKTEPEEFARKARAYMDLSCPERVEEYREYFQNWGLYP